MTVPGWHAPRATRPVDAAIEVPGSKSATNRALVLAALSRGTSTLHRPLRSRDTLLMAAALRSLGIAVLDGPESCWQVTSPGPPYRGGVTVDVGNAGTVARFLPPLATLAAGSVLLDGDPRVRERPLAPLVDALRRLGVDIEASGSGGLPIRVSGRGSLRGGVVEVDASASSQFVSGLLLSAPAYDEGVTVRHTGAAPAPSAPHLAMTVEMLAAAGASVHATADVWTVAPGSLPARDWAIEPDLSAAAPFLAAAVATGGRVRLRGWPRDSSQPGALLPGFLERFGAHWSVAGDELTVTGPEQISGVDLDLADAGELAPVLTALAALAAAPSRLRGIAHLRGQETDRLAALAQQVTRLGGDVRETDDGLVICPSPLAGGTFTTYDDHRLVMAAAVLGLVCDVLVEDPGTVAKTFPDFVPAWVAGVR